MSRTTFHRRRALQLFASVAALPFLALPTAALAQAAAARLIVVSDLHSAYERSAQLLAAIEAEIAAAAVPHAILVNGDVFELGNVVATRSGGVIDWALLARLARLAPTVLNIGNHEPDLVDDLATAVRQARDAGVTVLSNITDARTGAPFADAAAALDLGGIRLSLVGIATDAINTYPKALRETLDIPAPAEWAEANLKKSLEDGALPVVLSHAGVVADRAILPLLEDGSLLIGGHDHLLLTHEEGKTRYFHTGSWSSAYTVVDIAADRSLTVTRKDVAADGPADAELATLIEATLAEHLTDEERAVVGTSAEARTLGESARLVASIMAAAAEADIGFIGHTTFGTGFPLGPVSKYRFDAVVRFDGKLVVAEVDRPTLDALIARANQDGDIPLSGRTGDFLYSTATPADGKATYRIVTNDWSAINQKSYFGREDLVFSEVPDLRIKALVVAELSK